MGLLEGIWHYLEGIFLIDTISRLIDYLIQIVHLYINLWIEGLMRT